MKFPQPAVDNTIDKDAAVMDVHNAIDKDSPIQQLCLQTLEQEPASGGASISTSRMQVLNMRVYDVLLHILSSPRNRVCRI